MCCHGGEIYAEAGDPVKQKQELERIIRVYVDKNYDTFVEEMEKSSDKENRFYHFIYETVE